MTQQANVPKRALILDFDGVVVATEWLHFESWNRAFEELLGIRIGGSYKQSVGLSLAEIYTLWCQSAQDEPLTLSDEMKRRLLARKTELFFKLGVGQLTPMPGLVQLVHRARAGGWYVTIASRALRVRLLRTLEMAALPAIFDLVMGSEDVVDPSTNRKNHSCTVTPFGIDPAHCIVIEDSSSGIQDARHCNIGYVIGLTTSLDRATLLAAGADCVIDHLDEVQLKLGNSDR